ncbi:MAG: LamG domain-containing protein [Rhodocyclales bacterium]|nr:LamG domain-containing protein [Rhodocyclales bacterium]
MSGWRGAWLAAALALLAGAAQAATYAYRNDTFSYDTPSGSATTVGWHSSGASPGCTQYPNGDDDWADVAFPSGFTFTFGGTAYSGVRVYSNGILAFGTDVSGFHRDYSPQALPITGPPVAYSGCPRAVPVNLMLAYWIDIVAGTANGTSGASVRYEMLGTAPNRRFVISWVNVKLYNTTTRYNFQIALYESAAGTNGNFRYQYTSGSSNGSNATVGVQISTTDYTQYSYNQQFIDTTNGTAILWYPANQLATKAAEYRFDESVWTGVAGEIKDTSGNSRDASRVGAAASTANGRLCRAADIPRNTSADTIDAVATPLTVGQAGSIDFWFRSDSAWNASSSQAMLFDATLSQNRPFFLMKQADGALYFAVSDSTGNKMEALTSTHNYAANTWHHVGVTWNIRGGTNLSLIQIYLDGNLAATDRGTTDGTLPSLGTLYVGDNRTAGVIPSQGTGNSANGIIDEFYVYGIDVSEPQIDADMNLTRPTCTALDHFHIIHNGSAACGAANVTIEAHDLNHALFSLAGSTMSVATNTGHGSWSAVTAINPVVNLGGGIASYTFANEASVVFALTNPFTETVNINVSSGSITEHSYVAATCSAPDYTFGTVCDADLTFGSCVSAYECLATGLTYNNLTTPSTARNPLYTQLAGAAFSFDVIALDSSGNRVTGYASDADKTVAVDLIDGTAACASGTSVKSATLTYTKAGQPTDQGRKAVTFTAVDNAYPSLQCRVTDANTSVIACSSDRFAIRPQSLSISSAMNADTAGANTSATPTAAAGGSFTLSATGVVGYTGTPTIDATKVEAHSGAATTGSIAGAFSAGNVLTGISSGAAFAYNEVGYFRFAPFGVIDIGFTAIDQPDDCTDDFSNTAVGGKFGCKFGNLANTDYFGRFIPHHFDTAVTQGCTAGSFTYSGQPFGATVTALNSSNGTTQNYQGGFAKAVTLSDGNSATNNSTTLGTLSNSAVAAASFNNGVATANTPTYTFTTKTTAPMESPSTAPLKLRATDAEGVTSSGGTEGTTVVRSGRLRLSNVYGSLTPLTVPVERQYWTGNSWIRNAADTCTVLAQNNISLSPAGWGVAIVGGNIQLVPTGPGSVMVCADLDADHGVTCVATSAALPWLQSRWPGAATWDNDPSATATFGVFSPDVRRGIYNREMY